MSQQPPHLPPPDPDELASAIVDGLLPPHEAEAARRDPAVARRVEDILRVRAALRATPPPPAGAADRAVAAAMAAYDESPDVAPPPPPPRPLRVVATMPPPPPESRPSPRDRSTPGRWLAAAAAIVVVGLVAAGLISQGVTGDSGDDAATSAGAESAEESADDAGAETTAEPPAAADEADGGSGEALAAEIPYLGAAGDETELGDLVSAQFAAGEVAARQVTESAAPTFEPDDGDASGGGSGECPGLSATGDPARGTVTFVGDATFQGIAVVVHVYEQDGESTLVATDPDCEDVVDEPYTG